MTRTGVNHRKNARLTVRPLASEDFDGYSLTSPELPKQTPSAWASQSWLALEGKKERKLLLIPYRVIETLLPRLGVTAGVHWHFLLHVNGEPSRDKVLRACVSDANFGTLLGNEFDACSDRERDDLARLSCD
jgi:hypothetical protein